MTDDQIKADAFHKLEQMAKQKSLSIGVSTRLKDMLFIEFCDAAIYHYGPDLASAIEAAWGMFKKTTP